MGLFRILIGIIAAPGPPLPRPDAPIRLPDRPIPREMRFPVAQPNLPLPQTIISGTCRVIDGDTIVINRMHIRLAGIDAPELDHPWGQQSKWAMVELCEGQIVTACLKPDMSYDRVVAECFLPDGRDLAAELVKVGLAIDWPKFSGGKYRHLEPADARKKLWRANLRQSGVMWPTDDMLPAVARPEVLPFQQPYAAVERAQPRRANYRFGWLIGAGLLVLLAGYQLIGRGTDRDMPVGRGQQAPVFGSFEVTASALNVRTEPEANSDVLAQIGRGTKVVPKRVSGPWYGIEMRDGGIGWVHRDFLSPAED